MTLSLSYQLQKSMGGIYQVASEQSVINADVFEIGERLFGSIYSTDQVNLHDLL